MSRRAGRWPHPSWIVVVVAAIAAGAVVAVVAVWVYVVMDRAGALVDSGSVEAARSQYGHLSGEHHLQVVEAEGWSTCSVVLLAATPDTGPVSMVMIKTDAGWSMTRVGRGDSSFDLDDVGDEQECLALRRTTNG